MCQARARLCSPAPSKMKVRTAAFALGSSCDHFLLVWISVWRLPWRAFGFRALCFAGVDGAALDELESPLRLITKTTIAAISSATPTQNRIRVKRGEDREG